MATRSRALDREILRLAVPALGALVAEPLFVLTDTAMVGHLGAAPLAALGVAGAVLQTAVGLLVFLAYATTPAVARRLGAGDRPGAVRAGIDGLWLAAVIGVLLVAVGVPAADPLVRLFGAPAEVTAAASVYLAVSVWGLPAMLLVLAATGLLRGLQDTRTPLIVAVVGFAANALLNALLIYGLGWGIAGSAAGTVFAQWGMAAVYLVIAVRAARRDGVPLRPGWSGVSAAAASGGWLLLRTVSLRVALVATTVAGARLGTTGLGALQIALTLFGTLAFALDALAIAGQAMVGNGLGAAGRERVRAVVRRLVMFALVSGGVLGLVVAALSPVLGAVFTSDAGVREALVPVALLLAVSAPLAGYVFVLDGVLIGAGDARYLALTGILNLAVYLPLLALGTAADSLVGVWAAFVLGYLAARAATLGWRARGERWMAVGTR